MSLFTWFERKGRSVILDINTELATPTPIYPFDWPCADENYAELLTLQLNKKLYEYKQEIARDALKYLSSCEKSALKRKLKRWNGKKHCWKT